MTLHLLPLCREDALQTGPLASYLAAVFRHGPLTLTLWLEIQMS